MKMELNHRNARQRGTAYIAILGMSILLTVIGFSLVMVARINHRMHEQTRDWTTAQDLARSGLDFVLFQLKDDYQKASALGTNWRDGYVSGASNGPISFDGGTIEWVVEDADGNFSDDDTDGFTLTITATVGKAVYKLSGEMEPSPDFENGPALSCLQVAVAAGTQIDIKNIFTADQIIHSNNIATAGGGAQVYADVNAVNGVLGITYHGTNNGAATPVEMPPSTVFSHYFLYDTVIDYSLLPAGRIEGQVLSPSINPYGDTNAAGIYMIDCGGGNLEISNSRIIGTLLVANVGTVQILGGCNWEPAIPNYPALLCTGRLQVSTTSRGLRESDLVKNFNPAGAPWQTEEDSDQLDTFPNVIAGIIYAGGEIELDNGSPFTFEGVVVTGGMLSTRASSKNSQIIYRDTFASDPPPGFRAAALGTPRLVPGSLKRVVD